MNANVRPPVDDRLRARGSDRIQINNILSAVCLAILSVLLSVGKSGLSPWLLGQLACAVPVLVTSSLAYAKLLYRDPAEYHLWDRLGWATHSIGYLMILNTLTILLYTAGFGGVAALLLAVSVALFVLYSTLDILADRARLTEKLTKLGFYVLLLLVGSVVPILFGWL